MKNIFNIMIFFASFTGFVFAQRPIPAGLQEAMEKYLNDGSLKRHLIVQKIDTNKISEIIPGIPVEIYSTNDHPKLFFDTVNIENPVLSLVRPSGFWVFYLKAQGEYLFPVQFRCDDGKFRWAGTGGDVNAWSEVRTIYPENTGITPIIVRFGWQKDYLHFPQINDHNLTKYISKNTRLKLKNDFKEFKQNKNKYSDNLDYEKHYRNFEDQLSISTDSYSSLIDSKITLKVLKNENSILGKEEQNSSGRSHENFR